MICVYIFWNQRLKANRLTNLPVPVSLTRFMPEIPRHFKSRSWRIPPNVGETNPTAEDTAIIMYTSGSTGTPKVRGVLSPGCRRDQPHSWGYRHHHVHQRLHRHTQGKRRNPPGCRRDQPHSRGYRYHHVHQRLHRHTQGKKTQCFGSIFIRIRIHQKISIRIQEGLESGSGS